MAARSSLSICPYIAHGIIVLNSPGATVDFLTENIIVCPRGLAPEVGQRQLVPHGHHPHHKNEGTGNHQVGIAGHFKPVEQQVAHRSPQAGRGVYLLAEQHRCFVDERIAYHTTHHGREHAHDGGYLRSHAQRQCFFHAQNGKEGNAHGVKKQKRAAEAYKEFEKQVGHQCTQHYGVEEKDVRYPRERVAAQHDIAQGAPTDGRDETREGGAKEVRLTVPYRQRPADGKKQGAQQLKNILQVAHGAKVGFS